MDLNDKVTKLEDEIKILKNEVQAVLLDLRESYLSRENPFNPSLSPVTAQLITIAQQVSVAEEKPYDMTPEENQESELGGLEELTSEPEPVYKQELIADEETAHDEVKGVWRPEIEPGAYAKSRETTDGFDGKADLATIAGLVQWVAQSTKRLGRERVEVILDISEIAGHLRPDIKQVLVKFINAPDGYSGEVMTRDYLISLIELNGLLGNSNKSEVALLSILCQEKNHR